MIFRIGKYDISKFIAEGGLKWSWNGVDGPEAGRTLDTMMHRGLLAIKARVDVSCVWLTKENVVTLNKLLQPEFVDVVTDTCPWKTGMASFRMYSNSGKSTTVTEYSDGTQLFTDISFPLIER